MQRSAVLALTVMAILGFAAADSQVEKAAVQGEANTAEDGCLPCGNRLTPVYPAAPVNNDFNRVGQEDRWAQYLSQRETRDRLCNPCNPQPNPQPVPRPPCHVKPPCVEPIKPIEPPCHVKPVKPVHPVKPPCVEPVKPVHPVKPPCHVQPDCARVEIVNGVAQCVPDQVVCSNVSQVQVSGVVVQDTVVEDQVEEVLVEENETEEIDNATSAAFGKANMSFAAMAMIVPACLLLL